MRKSFNVSVSEYLGTLNALLLDLVSDKVSPSGLLFG